MKTLYISDLDGTLLDSNAEITDTSRKLLNKAIDSGKYFSVATARTSATVIDMLRGVHVNVPIVLMNGVMVYDTVKKEYVNSHPFSEKAKLKFISLAEEFGSKGFVFCLKNGELSTFYQNTLAPNSAKFIKEREEKFGKKFTKVSSFSDLKSHNIMYYSYSDKYEQIQPFWEKIKDIDGIRCEFYADNYNPDFWYFEVCSCASSKYNAVKFLRETYNFDKIIGFGDNLNDIPLFNACDEGYAVENAKDELKKIATGVLGKHTENAVAKYIESREN